MSGLAIFTIFVINIRITNLERIQLELTLCMFAALGYYYMYVGTLPFH